MVRGAIAEVRGSKLLRFDDSKTHTVEFDAAPHDAEIDWFNSPEGDDSFNVEDQMTPPQVAEVHRMDVNSESPSLYTTNADRSSLAARYDALETSKQGTQLMYMASCGGDDSIIMEEDPNQSSSPPKDRRMTALARQLALVKEQVAQRAAQNAELRRSNLALRSELRKVEAHQGTVDGLSLRCDRGRSVASTPVRSAPSDSRSASPDPSPSARFNTRAAKAEQAEAMRRQISRMKAILAGDLSFANSSSDSNNPEEDMVTEASFEMLRTVKEVKLLEEKNMLQNRVACLQRECEQLKVARLDSPTRSSTQSLSNRRRIQQMQAITEVLHRELRSRDERRSQAASSPGAQRTLSSSPGTRSAYSSASAMAMDAKSRKLDEATARFLRRFRMRVC
jgi:hypothetical protein